MQKVFIAVLSVIVVIVVLLQLKPTVSEAPAPDEPEVISSSVSSEANQSSEADDTGAASGVIRDVPTAESIKNLAKEYEERVESEEPSDE